MRIKKIILENIRSYEYQEINFNEGSTLLSGDIGSGKTSILLGIEFALFGLQPGQKGNALLKNGKEKGAITLDFEIDGTEVTVERILKKGSKSVSQDYCAITINGEKKEVAVTELKTKILELLNYPPEFSRKQNILYKFTVYTPQEEMKEIILQDAKTRTDTLRYIFGIDKYKRILENTSLLLSKIREERRRKEGATENLEQEKLNLLEKENELESKQYNLSSVEKELFLKKETRKKVQEELEESSKKVEEKNHYRQEIEKTSLMILNKQSSIVDGEREIEQINQQISELNKKIFEPSIFEELEKNNIFIKKEKEKLNEKLIEINSQITSLNYKNEDNRKLENKMSDLEICPTCLQNVDSIYRANVLNKCRSDIFQNNNKIEELNGEKIKIAQNIENLNFQISQNEKKLEELKIIKIKLEGIEEKKLRIEDLEKKNLATNKDINLLNQHIEDLRSYIQNLSEFDSLFEEKKEQLNISLSEEKSAEIKVAELRKEIEVFSRQIDELNERIKLTESIRKSLEYLLELENWISKNFISLISLIERNVMVKLKAEFSKSFSEWFSMLVPDTFNVRLNEEFTPIIEYQDYEIDYAYLSGGERTAIALAYRLSLNQVINSFLSKIKTHDLVILDEPTDGFSDAQLDKMRDVLDELNVGQLIIVSHEQKIESFVGNVVKLKKEKGISKIVNEN